MTVESLRSTISSAVRERAERELGRFLSMAVEGVQDLTMFSRLVDSVWHDLYREDEAYRAFCGGLGLPAVGHGPLQGSGEAVWVAEYERRYGKLDSVWFMDEHGALDTEAEQQYHRIGKVYCSWDCSPEQGTE